MKRSTVLVGLTCLLAAPAWAVNRYGVRFDPGLLDAALSQGYSEFRIRQICEARETLMEISGKDVSAWVPIQRTAMAYAGIEVQSCPWANPPPDQWQAQFRRSSDGSVHACDPKGTDLPVKGEDGNYVFAFDLKLDSQVFRA